MEDAIEIENYSIFKKGDVIPYRLPIQPSGSRYDVKAKSRYRDGQWTLLLYRKLDTGNEDDVSFNPLKNLFSRILIVEQYKQRCEQSPFRPLHLSSLTSSYILLNQIIQFIIIINNIIKSIIIN